MLAVESSLLLCRACMLVFALVEGAKLECVCDMRLPTETSVYTLAWSTTRPAWGCSLRLVATP